MRRTQREEGSIEIQARAQADQLSSCIADLHQGLNHMPCACVLATQVSWYIQAQAHADQLSGCIDGLHVGLKLHAPPLQLCATQVT